LKEEARESSKPAVRGRARLRGALLGVFACLVSAIGSAQLNAAQERYDYDALGRLIRVIDEQGRVTEYVYDAAGNILQVIRGDAPVAAPTVSAISPDLIRVGQTRQIRLSGTDLMGAIVSSPGTGLTIGLVSATPTELVLTVIARADAVIGPRQLTVANTVGATFATLNVRPRLALSTAPELIVIPPDSVAHAVVVRLSDADPAPLIFNLSTTATGIASLSPSTVTVPPGQTEFQVAITGMQAGRAFFSISSSALDAVQTFFVFVAANSAPRSALLGVYLPSAVAAPALVPSPLVGVHSPPAAIDTPISLPAPVLGVYSPAPPSNAPVALSSPLVGVHASPPGINVPVAVPSPLLGVSLPAAPQGITSLAGSVLGLAFGATPQKVEPVTVLAGSTVTLTVMGFALGSITGIALNPAMGITVTGPIQFGPDGSSASVSISIAPGTAATAREVVVSGTSGRIEFSDPRGSIVNVVGAP